MKPSDRQLLTMINYRAVDQKGCRRPSSAPPLVVHARSACATRGVVRLGTWRFPCALGRSGRRTGKREGDGATPFGEFALREVLYRADRDLPPRTGLTARPIRRHDGWCDEPADRNYNRLVRHPYPASAEHLMREDTLYDLIVVLGCNDRPRVRGLGSAIFIHLARPGYAPTAGCIALSRRDLLLVLRRCRRGTRIVVPL